MREGKRKKRERERGGGGEREIKLRKAKDHEEEFQLTLVVPTGLVRRAGWLRNPLGGSILSSDACF